MVFFEKKPSPDLLARVAALEAQLSVSAAQVRSLELEWSSTYDKIHRLFSRMAKRGAIDAPPAPVLDGLDPITRAIHARRLGKFKNLAHQVSHPQNGET